MSSGRLAVGRSGVVLADGRDRGVNDWRPARLAAAKADLGLSIDGDRTLRSEGNPGTWTLM